MFQTNDWIHNPPGLFQIYEKDEAKPFVAEGLLNNLVVLSFLKWDENCLKVRGRWQ